MTEGKQDRKRQESREAASQLEALRREGAELGGALAATARRTAAHFAGTDDPADDRLDIWGKRIGRALSAAACVVLALYLYLTYLK